VIGPSGDRVIVFSHALSFAKQEMAKQTDDPQSESFCSVSKFFLLTQKFSHKSHNQDQRSTELRSPDHQITRSPDVFTKLYRA
jgi:hypothetical protein